ncbi:hypothetical protein UVI_02016470 [Ustilaginoidea virens]|uniref:Uncharacterized protein n=1 Tax=Ustilaginoidea virens TaxID=1159556 RepID=A0A1B5KRW7_USTVR|nr:hypothetical protein UVI_02016470 [Ustilaginoidea virens]
MSAIQEQISSDKVCEAVSGRINQIVNEQLNLSRGFFSRNKLVQKSDVEAIERMAPQPVVTEGWTEEDEEWLQGLWAASRLKAELEKSPPTVLARLWKATVAFMRCSPCAIISPKHGLQWKLVYNGEGEPVTDAHGDSAICLEGLTLWSKMFCERLKTLVCHSIWRRDATFLATAIQVAVVCSMDYRGQWKMAFKGTNPEMQAIRAKMAVGTAASNQSVCEALKQQRQTGIARGETVSMELDFLCHLSSQVARVSSSRGQRAGAVLLPVTSVDLQAVINAIDSFCPSGIPMFIDTFMARAIADGVISNKSFPAAKEVPQLHERAILHEFRMYFRREREATREPEATRDLSRSASLPIRAGTAPTGTKRNEPLPGIEEGEASRGRKRARYHVIVDSGDEDDSRDEGDLPGGDAASAGAGRATTPRSRYSDDLGHGGSFPPSPRMPGRHGDPSNVQGEDDVGGKSGEAASGQEYGGDDDACMEEAADTEPAAPGQGHGGDDDVPMKEAADASVQPTSAEPAAAEKPPTTRPRENMATDEEMQEYIRREWPKHSQAINERRDAFLRSLRSLRARCENPDL